MNCHSSQIGILLSGHLSLNPHVEKMTGNCLTRTHKDTSQGQTFGWRVYFGEFAELEKSISVCNKQSVRMCELK